MLPAGRGSAVEKLGSVKPINVQADLNVKLSV